MSKWSEFIRGNYAGPVIQINNAAELHKLQEYASNNKLAYYEYFVKRGYQEILHILEINYGRLHNIPSEADAKYQCYKATKRNKSFLVEYSGEGFTFATLTDYDNDRHDPEDWKIYQMKDIINELEGR